MRLFSGPGHQAAQALRAIQEQGIFSRAMTAIRLYGAMLTPL
jgi:hypothetical protein